MNLKLLLTPFALAVLAPIGISHAAPELDRCPAERYKSCSLFMTSVEIGDHEEIIGNHLAGFTRSKGTWKITVRYQPETECAKVNVMLDMGPIDSPRQYKETFRNGGGVIRDSGSFMHKMDDLESALRIPTSSCHVPDQEASKSDAQAEGRDATEEEQVRLALEEERVRLALEREREQRELEKERERLALEREQLALVQELETAQERRRLEQERELQRRLAEQQRQEERERERLAEQERRQEFDALLTQLRLKRERQSREDNEQAATDAMMTGLALGFMGGVLDMLAGEGGGSFNPGALATLPGGGGTGCERIGQRLVRELETVNTVHGNSMCGMGRGMAQALSRARNDLAAMSCASSQELADMDRSIREARATARTSCGGN